MRRARRIASGPPRAVRGVSLLELLIVLMIIGFVSAIAIPMLSGGVSNAELRSASRQLAAGLRLARSEAVTQRRETFLVVDLAGRRFKVDRGEEHSLPKNMEMKLFTAQRDLVDASTGSIRFYPDGGSNGGRITLGAGDRKFEVDVDWLTGRVAILD